MIFVAIALGLFIFSQALWNTTINDFGTVRGSAPSPTWAGYDCGQSIGEQWAYGMFVIALSLGVVAAGFWLRWGPH